MKMSFRYEIFYEDEGIEQGLFPVIDCCEQHSLTQEKFFRSYMDKNFIYVEIIPYWFYFLQNIDIILEIIKNIFSSKIEKEIDIPNAINLHPVGANLYMKITPIETSFKLSQKENFSGPIPTEFLLLLLQAWRKYIESGTEETWKVDIPFDFDRELYREHALIRKKQA